MGATIVAENTGNCAGSDQASIYSVGYDLTKDTTGSACGFTAASDRVDKKPQRPVVKPG
jgi:hypothetical protein